MTEEQSKFSLSTLNEILSVLKQLLNLFVNREAEKPFNYDTFLEGEYKDYKKRWKNANNSKPANGDTFHMPSKTIPDQSLTIPEIMSRYSRGLPLGGSQVPVFDEDPENPMPDLSKMDLVDQFDHIESAKQEVRDIADKYKKEQDKKKQDAYNEYKRKYEELDKKFKKEQKGEDHFTLPNKDQKDPRLKL